VNGIETQGRVAALRRSSRHVLALRLVAFAAPVVVVSATMAARGAGQPVALVVFVLAGLACASSSDSHVGLVTMLLLALNWVQTVNDATTPWVLVAAAGMVLLHSSLAALTVAPPSARWPGPPARRWIRRSVLVWGAAVPVWLLSQRWAEWSPDGSATVLVLGLLASVTGGAWMLRRST
jgi:hypothetical protein